MIEKYKNLLENPDFEQDNCSRTAEGIYKVGHDSVGLMKRLLYYDRFYYENINYYDLTGCICTIIRELIQAINTIISVFIFYFK